MSKCGKSYWRIFSLRNREFKENLRVLRKDSFSLWEGRKDFLNLHLSRFNEGKQFLQLKFRKTVGLENPAAVNTECWELIGREAEEEAEERDSK